MRLQAYLDGENIGYADFGKLRDPVIPRVSVRQWARGDRFPKDPAILDWIATATGYQVTAADFVAHAMEKRADGVPA